MPVMFRVTSRVPEIKTEMREKASQLVRVTANEILADAKESMTGGKSGRWYGNHRASAPMEAPAIDLGVLSNSGMVEAKPGDLKAIVAFTAKYAWHLEFGTTRMEPRPFMGPAVDRAEPGFVAGMRSLLS